jgi:hypothetical protein
MELSRTPSPVVPSRFLSIPRRGRNQTVFAGAATWQRWRGRHKRACDFNGYKELTPSVMILQLFAQSHDLMVVMSILRHGNLEWICFPKVPVNRLR